MNCDYCIEGYYLLIENNKKIALKMISKFLEITLVKKMSQIFIINVMNYEGHAIMKEMH